MGRAGARVVGTLTPDRGSCRAPVTFRFTMERISEGLHASPPFDFFGGSSLRARAYLLKRPQGNVVLYAATALDGQLDELRELGGVAHQYLNHAHEASPVAAELRSAFGAPLHVHAADAAEVAETVSVDETFDERHRVDDDLEVVPIPGHTPGATAFLWHGPDGRALFTGDTIYVRDDEWIAAVLDGVSDRADYLASLELLAGLEFDLLVPGFASVDRPPVYPTDRVDARRRIEAIAARLRAGGDR